MDRKYIISAFIGAFITGIIFTANYISEAVNPADLHVKVEGNGVITESFGNGEYESRVCSKGEAFKADIVGRKVVVVRYPAWDNLCDGDNPIIK